MQVCVHVPLYVSACVWVWCICPCRCLGWSEVDVNHLIDHSTTLFFGTGALISQSNPQLTEMASLAR